MPRTVKRCCFSHDGVQCIKGARSGRTLCKRHGGNILCKEDGCYRPRRKDGMCNLHGAPKDLCQKEPCSHTTFKKHMCWRHYKEWLVVSTATVEALAQDDAEHEASLLKWTPPAAAAAAEGP